MKTRERLLFMALGGLLVLAGMVLEPKSIRNRQNGIMTVLWS